VGDLIVMADVKQKKSVDARAFDDAFWTAVAEEVRRFVTREIASLRSEFELRVNFLEERGVMEYVGTFEDGRQYARGNFVTHFGSLWHCNRTTRARPGDGPDWQLVAKRGRDGKDAQR
jgi:hypothetical protein